MHDKDRDSSPPVAGSPPPDLDTPKWHIKDHWKCLAACSLVSLCPFQYGVDFGLIGGLQAMVGFLRVFGHEAPELPGGWNISTERQQLISSLMNLGAFLSSSCVGPIAAIMGRKMSIWMACTLCCVSNIIMMATTDIAGLYAGRLLLGLANGMFMTFSQLYIQECTPARYRGLMISSFQVWTTVGGFVGTIVDNFTAKIDGRGAYLIPLGLIYIVPVILSVGLFFIPESPRWLVQHGRVNEARASLRWHRPGPDSAVVDELNDINLSLETQRREKAGVAVWDMFRNPVDRRRTILATCAVTVQGASGAMYVIAYGTYFFQMAGIGQPFENACILNGVAIIAILLNCALITRYGRRRVVLTIGLIVCGLTQLLIAVVYHASPGETSTGQAVVALTVLYLFGFNGMVSTYAWISGGELPSQRLRSYTFGFATAVGFFAAWLATFTTPYFINPESLNWGPKYGYIWAPSCFLAALWVYLCLPEVKDRTLEEIDEMFEARLPARKFRHHVCVGHNDAKDTGNPDVLKDKKAAEVICSEMGS